MIEIPPKIILTGDKDCARNFVGTAQSQLRILEGEMKFQDLRQGARKSRLDPKVTSECTVNHGFKAVNIHCETPEELKKEEFGEELLLHRFFAKVRKGGLYGPVQYYWIKIKKRGEGIKIETELVHSKDKNVHGLSVGLTLWALSNLPLHMNHAATKAFMLDKSGEGEEPELERWVATQHALATDTTIVFYPLYCAIPPGSDNYLYPYPWELGGDMKGGFTHPAPSSRFYCDLEKGIMAWYSAKTVAHPEHPDYPPINLVFGLLLRIDRGLMVGIRTFECNSLEVDGEGFDALWSLRESTPPPWPNELPLWPEVPIDMMSEVNSVSRTELEVTVPWGYRPIKYKIDLTRPSIRTLKSDHSYEAITSCNHWHWTKDGFEQKLFADFFQEDKSGLPDDYVASSGSGSGSSCSGSGEVACLAGCGSSSIGNVNNLSWAKNQRIDYSGTDIKSWIKTYIFDTIQASESIDMVGRQVYGQREYVWQCCQWDSLAEECKGPYNQGNEQQRRIEETTRQKIVDSIEAEWSSPNIAFLGSEIRRRRASNSARQWPTLSGFDWSGTSPDKFDSCFNRDVFVTCPASVISGGVCFYGYPFPNVDWADDVSTANVFQHITAGYEWQASQDADEYSKPLVTEFSVDGEETFSLSEYNRTYYLDDRSSENSEGLLVAARGATIEDYTPIWNYPIFDVDRWSVVYKFPDDEEFTEITDKLLEALGCDKTELIELGLI